MRGFNPMRTSIALSAATLNLLIVGVSLHTGTPQHFALSLGGFGFLCIGLWLGDRLAPSFRASRAERLQWQALKGLPAALVALSYGFMAASILSLFVPLRFL